VRSSNPRPPRRARLLVLCAFVALGLAAPGLAQSNSSPGLDPKWSPNGALLWPPNDGCATPPVTIILAPGNQIDRYGDESGRYFASPGVPFAARALPFDEANTPCTVYVLQKPLTVEACPIAAWFGVPGGGIQYRTAKPVSKLRRDGVLFPKLIVRPQ
jgi:hypothetical protein